MNSAARLIPPPREFPPVVFSYFLSRVDEAAELVGNPSRVPLALVRALAVAFSRGAFDEITLAAAGRGMVTLLPLEFHPAMRMDERDWLRVGALTFYNRALIADSKSNEVIRYGFITRERVDVKAAPRRYKNGHNETLCRSKPVSSRTVRLDVLREHAELTAYDVWHECHKRGHPWSILTVRDRLSGDLVPTGKVVKHVAGRATTYALCGG